MAFGTGASSARGGSPGFRFALYTILSIVIMFMDQKGNYLEQVRYGLSFLAYPLQLAVSSPTQAWRWMQESFATRDALRADNARLTARNRDLELRSMRYEALAHENDQLRGLQQALPPVAEKWLVAEIVDIQLNSLRQRVLVNRGSRNGLFKGQAVMDDKGLLGQTTHVGPFSAEVILITDPEHAVPVLIERTGLRTIAVGTGDTGSLALPYLPANADVKAGDVLITSGLGGVIPAGYPVGRVVEVHRDAVQPLAQVRAEPFASMNIDREVMLVWFREGHPAAPVVVTPGSDVKTGSPAMQAQVAPPKPAPVCSCQTPAPSNTPVAPGTKGAAGTATAPAGTSTSGSAPKPAAAAQSPGDAATLQSPPKPVTTKPATKPAPESDSDEGPPIEEDIPPKPEPKAPGASAPAAPKPQASAPQSNGPRTAQAPAARKPQAPAPGNTPRLQ